MSSRRGQSLIEALAAIAVTMLVVTSLVGLGVSAIRSATVSRNRASAVSYAQEGMEAIRSIRDRGYGELNSFECVGGAKKIYWSGSRWECQSGAEAIPDSIFTRSFTASEVTPGKLQVAVQVTWIDNAGSHTMNLDSYLTNWR